MAEGSVLGGFKVVVEQGSNTVIENVTDFVTPAQGAGNEAIKVPVCTPTWFTLRLYIQKANDARAKVFKLGRAPGGKQEAEYPMVPQAVEPDEDVQVNAVNAL